MQQEFQSCGVRRNPDSLQQGPTAWWSMSESRYYAVRTLTVYSLVEYVEIPILCSNDLQLGGERRNPDTMQQGHISVP